MSTNDAANKDYISWSKPENLQPRTPSLFPTHDRSSRVRAEGGATGTYCLRLEALDRNMVDQNTRDKRGAHRGDEHAVRAASALGGHRDAAGVD
eukprot:1974349-Pyramimonas_sp.AAC.1